MEDHVDELKIYHNKENSKLRKNFLKYILSDFDNFNEKKLNRMINWLFSGKYGYEPYTQFYRDYRIFKDDFYIKTKINLFLESLKNTRSILESCKNCNIPINKLNIWLELGKYYEKPFDILYDEYKSFSNSQLEEKINKFIESFNGFNETQACNDAGISPIELASWLRLHKLEGIFKTLYEQYLNTLNENDYSKSLDFTENSPITKNCLDMLFLLSDIGKTEYYHLYEDYNIIYSNNCKNKIRYPESHIERLLNSSEDYFTIDTVKLLNYESVNTEMMELGKDKERNYSFYRTCNIDKFLNYVALGYDDKESSELADTDYERINKWLNEGIDKLYHDTLYDDYNSSIILNKYLDFINNQLSTFKHHLSDGKSVEEICNILLLPKDDIELYLNLGYLNYEPYTVFYNEFEQYRFYNDKTLNIFLDEIEKGKFKPQAIKKSDNPELINEFLEKGKEGLRLYNSFFTDYKISLIKNYNINRNSKVKRFIDEISDGKSAEDASEISEIPMEIIEFWSSLKMFQEFKNSYHEARDPKFFLYHDAREQFLKNIYNGQNKIESCEKLPFSEKDLEKWLNLGSDGIKPYDEFYRNYLISIDQEYFNEKNIQHREAFIMSIEQGFKKYDAIRINNLPRKIINEWLEQGYDGLEPYVEFVEEYESAKYGDYFNDENTEIRKKFLKTNAATNSISSKKVEHWLSLGSKGMTPYNEFYDEYLNIQSKYIYKEFKLDKFLDRLNSGHTLDESLQKIKLHPNELKDICKKGKKHEIGYYKFYMEYNETLNKIFNEESESKREKFLEEFARGSTNEEALKIADLSKEYVEQCFSLKDESPYFKTFYNQYLKAEKEGYYFRLTEEKNRFIKLIQKGKTFEKACETVGLNKNKVQNWINLGENNQNEYTEFYNDYIQASIKFFNSKTTFGRRNIFLNVIRKGEKNNVACKKSKLDIKHINKWFSLAESEIEPFLEFKQEYDLATIEFFNSEEYHEKLKIFLASIETGETQTKACKNAGFDPYFVTSWINKGKKGITPYLKFYEEYNQTLVDQLNKNKYKIEEFFKLISSGKTNKKSCEISGLNLKMVNQWIAKGRDGHEVYLEFYNRYDEIKHGK